MRIKLSGWRLATPACAAIIIVMGVLALASCTLPGLSTTPPTQAPETILPTTTSIETQPASPTLPLVAQTIETTPLTLTVQVFPTPAPTATLQVITATTPALTNPPPTGQPSAGPQLALLRDGDVWLLDQPGGQAYPLTVLGNVTSFAWAPDGERLATFNGKELCFVHTDGSVRTACLGLGLDEMQSKIERLMIWSPDQRFIVLWNPVNPWDEGAIGWLVIALDGSEITYRIEDPVDWGASLAPNNEQGGITGQPVFLPDGKLVGTLTHRYLCGSGGCHYQLYQFDFTSRSFVPYPNKPEEGWSEGLRLELSADQRQLGNYGTFYNDCADYATFFDLFDLSSQARQTYNLTNEALNGLSLSPDLLRAAIARNTACTSQNQETWDEACGLSQGFDVFPMQVWDLASGERRDLAPGIMPAWSPDGKWIAFRSCLAQSGGRWQPTSTGPPAIYLIDPAGGGLAQVSPGNLPQWKPR